MCGSIKIDLGSRPTSPKCFAKVHIGGVIALGMRSSYPEWIAAQREYGDPPRIDQVPQERTKAPLPLVLGNLVIGEDVVALVDAPLDKSFDIVAGRSLRQSCAGHEPESEQYRRQPPETQ